MSRHPTSDGDPRGRDATELRHGLVGIVMVVALASGAAMAGWLLSLLVAWVY